MRIAIGADHGGFEQKQELKAYIANELGCEVEDMGCDSTESVDYPDYAAPVARAVAEGSADFGVLVCGTGIGMAIAADKIDGVRAYEMARAGEEAPVRKALINIYELEMTRFELPYMDIRVRCSRGTYIRSLAAEIGEELHSGAYLTALRRTRSGGFRVEDALNLDFFLEKLSQCETKSGK